MDYGYVRVSKDKQHEDRQLVALLDCGIDPANIYIDKQSGKDFARQQYQNLMKKLQAGDTLFIKSIYRLGRNYDEILEQWRILTKEMDVDVVVLEVPLLDTRIAKDLLGTLIADLVLQLFAYSAHHERDMICQRTREGLARRRAAGVTLGRPKGAKSKVVKLSGKEEAIRVLLDEGTSISQIARLLHCDRSTLSRFIRDRMST